eukprot:532916-Amphidinium_carterae.1
MVFCISLPSPSMRHGNAVQSTIKSGRVSNKGSLLPSSLAQLHPKHTKHMKHKHASHDSLVMLFIPETESNPRQNGKCENRRGCNTCVSSRAMPVDIRLQCVQGLKNGEQAFTSQKTSNLKEGC